MKKSMLKNGLILGLFALVCTALISLIDQFTAPQIKRQEVAELEQILEQIIPADSFDNAVSQHCILIQADALGTDAPMPAYIATKQGIPTAIAMETIAPDGYNGKIKIIMAIDTQGKILGVRTLFHQETPGLGDKIDHRRSDWIFAFTGLQLNDDNRSQWRVKKDGGIIDQFTGATITPRAYVKALRKTLDYFNQHQAELLQQTANCEAIK